MSDSEELPIPTGSEPEGLNAFLDASVEDMPDADVESVTIEDLRRAILNMADVVDKVATLVAVQRLLISALMTKIDDAEAEALVAAHFTMIAAQTQDIDLASEENDRLQGDMDRFEDVSEILFDLDLSNQSL